MIIAIGEYMKTHLLSGAGQVRSIIDIKYFVWFGFACLGSNTIDLVIRLARSFFIRKDVFVKAVHEAILFLHMLIMHCIGIGYKHGAILFGYDAKELDHARVGLEDVIPYPFKFNETYF